jgi:hypothetical protein
MLSNLPMLSGDTDGDLCALGCVQILSQWRVGGFATIQWIRRVQNAGNNKILSFGGSRLIPTFGSGSRAFAVIGSPFRRSWNGSQAGHPSSRSWPIIRSSNRMTSLPCMLTPPNWRQAAKSPEDEAPLRRELITQAGSTAERFVP